MRSTSRVTSTGSLSITTISFSTPSAVSALAVRSHSPAISRSFPSLSGVASPAALAFSATSRSSSAPHSSQCAPASFPPFSRPRRIPSLAAHSAACLRASRCSSVFFLIILATSSQESRAPSKFSHPSSRRACSSTRFRRSVNALFFAVALSPIASAMCQAHSFPCSPACSIASTPLRSRISRQGRPIRSCSPIAPARLKPLMSSKSSSSGPAFTPAAI